jgi:molybdate transport system substrate-binding protein
LPRCRAAALPRAALPRERRASATPETVRRPPKYSVIYFDTMKPRLPIAAVLAFCVLAVPASRADEIRVAVATNFSEVMDELARRFEPAGGHTVLVSAASSGALYAQIRNGAPFDLFFSADAERPRLLEEEGAAVAGTRFTYAIGRLALWSPDPDLVDDEGAVLSTGDFRFLAIANPELAPYGAAARQVLERRGLWEGIQDRLVRGQDIGQAYAFVFSRNAELGFVAWSQLRRPDASVGGSYWLVPGTDHDPIEQQAVLLVDSPAARAFVAFVRGAEGGAVIRGFGYGP